MANVPLKSIKFPGLNNVYTVPQIDDTLAVSGAAADAKEVGDELTDLKDDLSQTENKVDTSISRTVDSRVSTETAIDLDIADESGNVLARFKDGHIETKYFNSSDVPERIAYIANSETDNLDIDIADEYGNVLARFKDGGIQTKCFRGFTYRLFQSQPVVYTGEATTLTINQHFDAGDRIVLHVERGAYPWNGGVLVDYYVGNRAIKTNWKGDCAYLEYTVTAPVDQITAIYGASAIGLNNGDVLTLEVALLGDIPITPTVVTIKKDGSGDFTNLKDCLAYIGYKANDVLNPYRIEIYPGEYQVLDDYSDEEISQVGETSYTQTSFCGPKLLNGMSLVGMGRPQDIILYGYLDTEKWTSHYRGQISTLNCQGTCSMENLTVIAENLRYCVHDDFNAPYAKPCKRLVKNCIFRGYGAMSYTPSVTYGAGCQENGLQITCVNCDFGTIFGIHNNTTAVNHAVYTLENCRGIQAEFGDLEKSGVDGCAKAILLNCDFEEIFLHTWGEGAETYSEARVEIYGVGGTSPLYNLPPFAKYITKDTVQTPLLTASVGDVVERYRPANRSVRWRAASNVNKARGIVIASDNYETQIQVSGYVATDKVGLTGFSEGDLVGLDANGHISIVQNESDSFGVVAMVSAAGVGYIKLNWRV